MARGRGDDDRRDVIAVNKTAVEFPVEHKNEFVLRVGSGNSPQRFMREPADALEFIFQQQAGVDGYEQISSEFIVQSSKTSKALVTLQRFFFTG